LRQSLPMIGRHLWPSIAELKPHCPALHCTALHCTALHCCRCRLWTRWARRTSLCIACCTRSSRSTGRQRAVCCCTHRRWRGTHSCYGLQEPRNFRPPAQQLCQQCSSMTPVVAASEFACVAVGNATRRSETFCFCALGFRA
jgi:hypothetical protein